MTDLLIQRSAILSPCGDYRLRLERSGLPGNKVAAGIMVNPSTADAYADDQTIKKWYGFSERLGWAACVAKYDRAGTFFYLDPPYLDVEGYGVEFGPEQYERMAQMAASAAGKMLISINDHEQIRRVFKGLRKQRLKVDYTVGGSARGRGRYELLIRNW